MFLCVFTFFAEKEIGYTSEAQKKKGYTSQNYMFLQNGLDYVRLSLDFFW